MSRESISRQQQYVNINMRQYISAYNSVIIMRKTNTQNIKNLTLKQLRMSQGVTPRTRFRSNSEQHQVVDISKLLNSTSSYHKKNKHQQPPLHHNLLQQLQLFNEQHQHHNGDHTFAPSISSVPISLFSQQNSNSIPTYLNQKIANDGKTEEVEASSPNFRSKASQQLNNINMSTPPTKSQHHPKYLKANYNIIVQALNNRVKLIQQQNSSIQQQYQRIRNQIVHARPSDIKICNYNNKNSHGNGKNQIDYEVLKKIVFSAITSQSKESSYVLCNNIENTNFHKSNSQLEQQVQQKMQHIQLIQQSIRNAQSNQAQCILQLQQNEEELKHILKTKGSISQAEIKEKQKKNKSNQIRYIRQIIGKLKKQKNSRTADVVECLKSIYKLRMQRCQKIGKAYQFGSGYDITSIQGVLKDFATNLEYLQKQYQKQKIGINSLSYRNKNVYDNELRTDKLMTKDYSTITLIQSFNQNDQNSSIKNQILQNLQFNTNQLENAQCYSYRNTPKNSGSRNQTPAQRAIQNPNMKINQFFDTQNTQAMSKSLNKSMNGTLKLASNTLNATMNPNQNKLQAKKSIGALQMSNANKGKEIKILNTNSNQIPNLQFNPINCNTQNSQFNSAPNIQLKQIIQQYQQILQQLGRIKELQMIYFMTKKQKLQQQCKIKALEKYYLVGLVGYEQLNSSKQCQNNFNSTFASSKASNPSIEPFRYDQIIYHTLKKCQEYNKNVNQKLQQRSKLTQKLKNVQQSIKILNTQIQNTSSEPLRKQQALGQIQNLIENEKKKLNSKLNVMKDLVQQCQKLKYKKNDIEQKLEECAQRGDLQGYKSMKNILEQIQKNIQMLQKKMENQMKAQSKNNQNYCTSLKIVSTNQNTLLLSKIKETIDKYNLQLDLQKVKYKNLGQLFSKITRRLQVI